MMNEYSHKVLGYVGRNNKVNFQELEETQLQIIILQDVP